MGGSTSKHAPHGTCPSPSFQWCAGEGGQCQIPDVVRSGYVSFGTSDTVVFIPFTNTGGGVAKIPCFNNPGFRGLSFGEPSYCCFISTETPFTQDGYYPIGKGPWIAYRRGTVVYQACSGDYNELGYAVCMYAAYNSSWAQLNSGNTYYVGNDTNVVRNIEDLSWKECGTGGAQCTGLNPNALYWIRYGVWNTYTYRLVASLSTGRIPCTSRVFGKTQMCDGWGHCSAMPQSDAFCSRSEPQYIFENARGEWHLLEECFHCDSLKHSYTVGVKLTKSSSTTVTNSWSVSIMEQFSAGFTFNIPDLPEAPPPILDLGSLNIGGNVQIQGKYARTTTKMISSSFTHTLEETETQTCSKGSFYQWQMSAAQFDGFDKSDVEVQGSYFVCIGYGLTPRCPPPFCKDENCQNCTIDLLSMKSSNAFIDKNDHDDRKQVNNNQWLFGCVFAVLLVLLLIFGLRKRTKSKTRNNAKRKNILNASDAVISYNTV